MPLGIPDRGKITSPAQTQYQVWQLTIHEHDAKKAGKHYDLRLVDPRSGVAHSWALRNLPSSPGAKTLAVQQPDHSEEYTHFEGEIAEGYGAGKVRILLQSPVEMLDIKDGKITFNMYKGSTTEKYALIQTGGTNWLFFNYTPTTKSLTQVPQYKISYKNIKPEQIDFQNTNEVLAPKYDGASVAILIRKDKPLNVFSYRPSKKGESDLIEHSYRTNLYKVRGPSTLHDTVLRAELFGRKKDGTPIPAPKTGGILNANVWKSREKQQAEGALDNVIYDVVRYRGKNVEDEPYEKKIGYLKTISQEIPQLRVPLLAVTPEEKQKLYSSIVSGGHPETTEGVIVYNKSQSQPQKAKITRDYDVYVQETYPGTGRLKSSVGGFKYSLTPEGPIVGKVGGGFSDEMRRMMAAHPEDYKRKLAKINAQAQHPSGAYRSPIFKEWRDYEKWPTKTAEQITLNLSGDVQGVGLRRTVHQKLDELGKDGLAVNDVRSGKVSVTIPEEAKVEVLEAIKDRLKERGEGEFTAKQTSTQTLKPAKITTKDIEAFAKGHGFTKRTTQEHAEWLKRHYRLKEENGTLVGSLTPLANAQIKAEEPLYKTAGSLEADDYTHGDPLGARRAQTGVAEGTWAIENEDTMKLLGRTGKVTPEDVRAAEERARAITYNRDWRSLDRRFGDLPGTIKTSSSKELIKTAINRPAKELRKLLGLSRRSATHDMGNEAVQRFDMLIRQPGDKARKARQLLDTGTADSAILRGRELSERRIADIFHETRHIRNPGRKARPIDMARSEAIARRTFSGAHAPKANERLIAAGATAEDVATKPLRTKYLFRGNPTEKQHKATWMSRHPDVAAGYSTGRAVVQRTEPTNKLEVYRKRGLARIGEAPTEGKDVESWLASTKETRRKASQIKIEDLDGNLPIHARATPTYEDVILSPKRKRLKPAGEYSVRRSRTAAGEPAYAVSHVSGLSTEQAFAGHLLKKSAAFIHFPKEEHEDLKKRLKAKKPIYTTRVSEERGKYKKNEILISTLGKLKVESVKPGRGLKSHPFADKVTKDQKEQLGMKPYDFVELTKAAAEDSPSFKDHAEYAKYVLYHKKNMIGPGRDLGVGWGTLLKHDLSKFRPSEWNPYVAWWEGPKGLKGTQDPETYRTWRAAVDQHYEHNPHHAYRVGEEQDAEHQLEAVTDWYSVYKTRRQLAGKPYANFATWYKDKKPGKHVLSPQVKALIEERTKEAQASAEQQKKVQPDNANPNEKDFSSIADETIRMVIPLKHPLLTEDTPENEYPLDPPVVLQD